MSAQAPPAHGAPGAALTFLFLLDRDACRRRNGIERLLCLKNWRRVATRYHLASLVLVAVAGERP